MNSTWTNWILGGALAASVTWNLCAPRPAAPAESCCSEVDPARLNLRADQRAALESWTERTCGKSCRSEAETSAALAELHRALQEPATPESEIHALAAEVSRLRAGALDACVEAILAVRRVLDREQLALLLESCGNSAACAK